MMAFTEVHLRTDEMIAGRHILERTDFSSLDDARPFVTAKADRLVDVTVHIASSWHSEEIEWCSTMTFIRVRLRTDEILAGRHVLEETEFLSFEKATPFVMANVDRLVDVTVYIESYAPEVLEPLPDPQPVMKWGPGGPPLLEEFPLYTAKTDPTSLSAPEPERAVA